MVNMYKSLQLYSLGLDGLPSSLWNNIKEFGIHSDAAVLTHRGLQTIQNRGCSAPHDARANGQLNPNIKI